MDRVDHAHETGRHDSVVCLLGTSIFATFPNSSVMLFLEEWLQLQGHVAAYNFGSDLIGVSHF